MMDAMKNVPKLSNAEISRTGVQKKMSLPRYFVIKCPNCGNRIHLREDVVSRGEHPIYRCRECGTNLQWDTMRILWLPLLSIAVAGIVYVTAKPAFMALLRLSEPIAGTCATVASFVAVVFLLPLAFGLRPVKR